MNIKRQRITQLRNMHRRGARGQAFTELAVSFMFLLILLMVVVDLGWAFYTMIALRDAAQEAASYGAVCPFEEPDPLNPTIKTANIFLIRQRLRLSATAPIKMEDIDLSDINIQFTQANGTVVTTPVMGGNIVVTATIHHKIMTPFVGAFIAKQEYPLTVTVADTVMRSEWLGKCNY